jgi:ring-1,2-phenylacetyl-CoA epoxidase subunit PaaE
MNFTLKVVAIRQETDDTVTLCFKQPGLKKIKYVAGQYLTLIFRINGRRYIRPYSFSSCMGVDEYIEITIKRVKNGVVSNHICDVVKVDDVIEVMSPMGDFIIHKDILFTSVYLWAVGSGITPIISIAKYILHFEPSIKVHLIYGNRNMDSTIFSEQIRIFEQNFAERFVVHHFHTKFEMNVSHPRIIEGRISQVNISKLLSDCEHLNNTLHYICGPAGLKESVKNGLADLNIASDHIYSEDFELLKDPKEFTDITTKTVNLEFNKNNIQLEVTKGKSILEAALDADIELPYSCQTGSCSTCKGVLLSGDMRMIGLQHKRDDLNDEEYLLCCTYPLSENVHIKI